MAFNYAADKDRMVAATVAYWLRYTEGDPGNAQPTDVQAAQVTDATSRNCTAVTDMPTYLPFVAMNQWNTPAVVAVFPNQGGVKQYNQITDTTDQKHAELKALDYFYHDDDDDFPELPDYIGISKLCCLRCAVVLKIAGVGYRGSSGETWNAGWAPPTYLTEREGAFTLFLGDNEADFKANDGHTYNVLTVYETLSSTNKADYYRALQVVQN